MLLPSHRQWKVSYALNARASSCGGLTLAAVGLRLGACSVAVRPADTRSLRTRANAKQSRTRQQQQEAEGHSAISTAATTGRYMQVQLAQKPQVARGEQIRKPKYQLRSRRGYLGSHARAESRFGPGLVQDEEEGGHGWHSCDEKPCVSRSLPGPARKWPAAAAQPASTHSRCVADPRPVGIRPVAWDTAAQLRGVLRELSGPVPSPLCARGPAPAAGETSGSPPGSTKATWAAETAAALTKSDSLAIKPVCGRGLAQRFPARHFQWPCGRASSVLHCSTAGAVVIHAAAPGQKPPGRRQGLVVPCELPTHAMPSLESPDFGGFASSRAVQRAETTPCLSRPRVAARQSFRPLARVSFGEERARPALRPQSIGRR